MKKVVIERVSNGVKVRAYSYPWFSRLLCREYVFESIESLTKFLTEFLEFNVKEHPKEKEG